MLIKNCRCFDGIKFIEELMDILVQDGKIEKIIKAGLMSYDGEKYDADGSIVCPGFIDIHTHGIGGFDNSDIHKDEVKEMAVLYHKAGSTTFIPSLPTISIPDIRKALDVYSSNSELVPGVHLEGPFINAEKRGAQNPVHILRPTVKSFTDAVGENIDLIMRVTIAPEKDEDFKFTRFLKEKGISISFGHTVCDSSTAGAFFDITDSIGTHMFNAMPSIHHRSPSITTVALNRDEVYCEVIPDLIHVHPEIIKMLFNIKGAQRTIAVSDSMLAAGLPDGEYDFAGIHVIVKAGSARLKAGNLAGSIITLAEGVRNIIKCGVKPESALASGTSTPAEASGLSLEYGYIKKGYMADILILEDDYSIGEVFKSGKLI